MINELLYFISDDNGNSYSNDENGALVSLPYIKPIDNTPDGWQDMAIKYGRNDSYYGIIRSYTIPLGFVKLGARIARQLYYTVKGIQASALLTIARYVHEKMDFTLLYSSELNFSTFDDSEDFTEVATTDGDLSAMIAANEGTTYEIPIEVPEAINVLMDGITLYSVVKALNYSYQIGDGTVSGPGTFERPNVFMGFTVVDSETKYPSVLWNETIQYYSSDTLSFNSTQWLMKVQENVTIRLKSSSFKVMVAGANSYRLLFYVVNAAGTPRQVQFYPTTVIPGTPQNLDISFDVSIDFQAGDTLYPVFNTPSSGAGLVIQFAYDNTIEVTYNYRKSANTIKWLPPLYVYNQLISKISDGKYNGASSFLAGEGAEYVMTCGDALRGFSSDSLTGYPGPKIKTSLRDFFASYNTRFNIGISIENNVAVLEKKEYFYRGSSYSAQLGGISDLHVKPALDLLYSSIKIGWPEQTYEDVNGREEFNTTHTYTTPLNRVSNVYDVTSAYRADCYGIEFTRVNLDSKTTTDSDSDDDIFILNVSNTGSGYVINRPPGSIVSGVIGGLTTFNWLLTPKRCLLAHGNWIRSAMAYHDDKQLIFSTSPKNQLFFSNVFGTPIQENSNVPISGLANRLFLPHLFDFTGKTPYNIVDLIEQNPFGVISFEWLGNAYTGFIVEASQQPAQNPQQQFTLLAAPSNKIENLVR